MSFLADLAKNQSVLCASCSGLREFAVDSATGDLIDGRIEAHDENAWTLRGRRD